jgi:ribosomal protein L37AE/L43A
MELRSQRLRFFHQSRPIVPCAQCGDTLFAPEWSEYLDERRVRHLWSCDSCGYEFESLVCYPATTAHAV